MYIHFENLNVPLFLLRAHDNYCYKKLMAIVACPQAKATSVSNSQNYMPILPALCTLKLHAKAAFCKFQIKIVSTACTSWTYFQNILKHMHNKSMSPVNLQKHQLLKSI